MPPEKRIDLSIDLADDDDDNALFLDLDRPSTPPPGPTAAKSYKKLLQEVPHSRFASAADRFPDLVADLEAGRDSPADPAQGQSHPPSFLSADDLDNYLYELDALLAAEDRGPDNLNNTTTTTPAPLPTLAPVAHADRPNPKDAQRDFAVRNPTSVYNWLRKHAPKTFLQDAEHDKDGAGAGAGSKENGDDHHGQAGHGHGLGSGRRGKGERAPRGGGTGGASRGKRTPHGRTAAADDDADDDAGHGDRGGGGAGGAATPSTVGGGGKGKRKRIVDEDPGYRPKGGASRPTKKKRKSEGGGDETPTAAYKGPRKSGPWSTANYGKSSGARKSSMPSAPWSARREEASESSAGYDKGSGSKGPRKSSMPTAPWAGRRDED